MKNLFVFTFILISLFSPISSAHAQTPVGKEQANAYFANCLSKEDPRMQKKSHEAFCACTSVHMMQKMSQEDVVAMGGNNQAARDALNKMLLDVYAPCMNYPLEDMITAECMVEKKINSLGVQVNKEKVCGCMAKRTANWFVKDGRKLFQTILMKNPNIYDPIGPVMESQTFKSQSYSNMLACINGEPE